MQKQLEKLYGMAGKDWLYKKSNIKILGAMAGMDKVTIKVQDHEKGFQDMEISTEDLDEFMKNCLPVDMTPTVITEQAAAENRDTADAMIRNSHLDIVDLRNEVLEVIQKVKDDPNYIPQAKAINNNVNTIVNMTKLEFNIAKELKRSK